ncbi:MAG: hypothetical protein OSJ62_02420 [Lachnospiraceae bacterium]|nr:hypothetical protein [Lachnospiraceae bacterium]
MKELEKKELEKKYHEEDIKMQKALQDVKNILDSNCEQGKLEKEIHDKILDEMKQIFQNRIGEKTILTEEEAKNK